MTLAVTLLTAAMATDVAMMLATTHDAMKSARFMSTVSGIDETTGLIVS